MKMQSNSELRKSCMILRTLDESIGKLAQPSLTKVQREDARLRRKERASSAYFTEKSMGRRSETTVDTEAISNLSLSGRDESDECDSVSMRDFPFGDDLLASDVGVGGTVILEGVPVEVKADAEDTLPTKMSVSFSTVMVRSFPIILGDNPSVSRGPPITISWTHYPDCSYTIPLQEYEEAHPPRRSGAQLFLPQTYRELMLKDAGVGRGEMREAEEVAQKIQKQRIRSAKALGRKMHIRSCLSKVKVWGKAS